ncbi:hypothetical protein ACHAXA_011732 [Cyclostephanos tholiformis]|uniref:Uncharacterized protein n=1 Tax=Cyclostephanos tholiformis TaxID=382380 RepID=A0ABD3RZH5_9STRA
MSRRYVLKDSDSEDSDYGGDGRTVTPNSSEFFTKKEIEAIDKCKIQINDNWGIYSDDYTSRAIAKVGMSLIELVVQDGAPLLYQKHRVKVGSERMFFDRAIYKVHGPKSDDFDPECLEEAILLEIETLRRSEKSAKNRLFKNKETGGMVVFGPWFNYALQRLLRLSSIDTGETATSASLGEYTAVKIIRSLFSFITEDLKDVVKPGRLQDLKNMMGVDWEGNVNAARKVINHCGGSAHFLHKEFTIVEAYVESLKSKPPKASAAAASPPSNTALGPAPSKQLDVSAARNMRMAAMRAQAAGHLLADKPAAQSDTKVSASPSANDGWGRKFHTAVSASSSANDDWGRKSHTADSASPSANDGWGRKSHTAVSASLSANDGWGRTRVGESAAQPHTYSRAASHEGLESTATNKESSTTQSHNTSRTTMATSNQPYNPNDRAASQSNEKLTFRAPSQGSASSGWGRTRDGNSVSQPSKARGSSTFVRGMLGSNIPVNNASREPVICDRESAAQSHTYSRATSHNGLESMATNKESSTTQSYNSSRATMATSNHNPSDRAASQSNEKLTFSAPSLGSASSGWGRTRDGNSAIQPSKARGSSKFARGMLGSNIPMNNSSQEPMMRAQKDNSGGDLHNPPSRSDDYSSRSVGNSSFSRYDDRSSDDRGSDGGRDDRAYQRSGSRVGGREDYPYSNPQGGSSSLDLGEEYRSSSSREGS